MNIIMRAILSLKDRAARSVRTIVAFTVLFTVILSSLAIFIAASNQINIAEKNLANAISICSPVIYSDNGKKHEGQGVGVPVEIAEAFLSSDYLEGYNIEEIMGKSYLIGAEPFYKFEKEYDKSNAIIDDSLKGVFGFGVADSERSRFFAAEGYELVKGEHLIPEDGTQPYVLVTEEFAQKNGFDIGSEYTLDNTMYSFELKIPLKIKGIYRLPDEIYNLPMGDEYAHNYQLVAVEHFRKLIGKKSGGDRYGYTVTAYLKNQKDLNAFIEETKQKVNIGMVSDHITKSTSGVEYDEPYYISVSEARKEIEQKGSIPYVLKLDRDWFDMVAKPMRNVSNITLLLAAALIAGAGLILILMTIMDIGSRKREMGILIAVGESKVNIVLQVMIELLIPIVISLLLSIALSSIATESFGNYLITQNSAETLEENETVHNEIMVSNNTTGKSYMAFSRSSLFVEAKSDLKIEISTGLVLAFVLSLLDVILLILFFQVISILRLKPAEILMGRR